MQLLFLQDWFNSDTGRAIAWTLLHSLWQGLLAAFIVAIIIIATRRSSAKLRYNLLSLVLVLFVVTTVVTFSTVVTAEPVGSVTDSAATAVKTGFNESVAASLLPVEQSTNFRDNFIAWFNDNTSLLMIGWCLLFLLNCFKLLTGLAAGHRLRTYRKVDVSEEWVQKLERLSIQMGLQKTIRLLESGLVKVPVTLGFLKPVILVPIGLLAQLPPEQAETILLHELAHIRRKDYLVNLLQRFTESVFFFNPGLLWISSLLRQEREACCDDLVMQHTEHNRNYLDALVAFQEYEIRPASYAIGIVGKRQYLLERVKRIITRENRRLGWIECSLLVVGMIVLTAFTFIPGKEKFETIVNELGVNTVNAVTPVDVIPTATNEMIAVDTPLPAKNSKIKQENTRPGKLAGDKKDSTATLSYEFKIMHYDRDVSSENNTLYETIRVKGPGDKRYIIRKVNGKCVVFMINEFVVDKKEIETYKPLIAKIERSIQPWIAASNHSVKSREKENEARYEEIATKKEELASKKEEIKEKDKEIQLHRKNNIDNKFDLIEKDDEKIKEIEKRIKQRNNPDSVTKKVQGNLRGNPKRIGKNRVTGQYTLNAKLNQQITNKAQKSMDLQAKMENAKSLNYGKDDHINKAWNNDINLEKKWELKFEKIEQPAAPPNQKEPGQPPKKAMPPKPKT